MSSSPVRIALVGLDHWYSAFPFVDTVAAHDEATLVGIADTDRDRVQVVARRGGVERVTTRPEELIEDESVDVIVSFISVDQNPSVCVAAAEHGKHILSIKPLARTAEEATRILTAVRDAGVVFLPAESRARLSEQNSRIRQWVSEGRFGDILTAHFSLWAGLPQRWQGDSDPGWFADAERAPGGGWIDHSIYHIDLLRWLIEDEVKDVSGRAANLKYPDLPVEDYGVATVQFQKGAIATLEDTWLASPGAFRSNMNIVGTQGAMAYDSLTGRFSVAGDFPPFTGWVHTTPGAANTDGLDHLIASIRGEESPIATVEDAWRNLSVCRAFYDAADAGSTVAPADIPTR